MEKSHGSVSFLAVMGSVPSYPFSFCVSAVLRRFLSEKGRQHGCPVRLSVIK